MSKLGTSMSTMMGMNDYGFLYSTGSVQFMSTMRVKSRQSGMGDGDEDVKRPSIDDFDSEISISKGSLKTFGITTISCNHCLYFPSGSDT